jgi:hypothetical protein
MSPTCSPEWLQVNASYPPISMAEVRLHQPVSPRSLPHPQGTASALQQGQGSTTGEGGPQSTQSNQQQQPSKGWLSTAEAVAAAIAAVDGKQGEGGSGRARPDSPEQDVSVVHPPQRPLSQLVPRAVSPPGQPPSLQQPSTRYVQQLLTLPG